MSNDKHKIMPNIKAFSEKSVAMYFDYINNFLTVEAFATHYGITERKAKDIIFRGNTIRDFHNNRSFDYNNRYLSQKYSNLTYEQRKFLIDHGVMDNIFTHFYKGNYSKIVASVTHVSQSGMTRHISFMMVLKDGNTYNLNHFLSNLLGYKREYGLIVKGCGMDMVASVLYKLAYLLPAKSRGKALLNEGMYARL